MPANKKFFIVTFLVFIILLIYVKHLRNDRQNLKHDLNNLKNEHSHLIELKNDATRYFNKFNQLSSASFKVKFDNVTLVSYAGGNDIYYLNQLLLVKSAHDYGIDRVFIYNPRDIDKKFYDQNKEILSSRRGVGYWLWKPYIILDAMSRVPEGNIIIYIDSDLYIINDISPLIKLTEKYNRLFWKNFHTNLPYTKRDAYIILDQDNIKAYNSFQLEGGFMMFKNTSENREFVKEWLIFSQDKRAISDEPSVLGSEFPEFKDHRHDQSTVSLLSLGRPDQILIEHDDLQKFVKMYENNISFFEIIQNYFRSFKY